MQCVKYTWLITKFWSRESVVTGSFHIRKFDLVLNKHPDFPIWFSTTCFPSPVILMSIFFVLIINCSTVSCISAECFTHTILLWALNCFGIVLDSILHCLLFTEWSSADIPIQNNGSSRIVLSIRFLGLLQPWWNEIEVWKNVSSSEIYRIIILESLSRFRRCHRLSIHNEARLFR